MSIFIIDENLLVLEIVDCFIIDVIYGIGVIQSIRRGLLPAIKGMFKDQAGINKSFPKLPIYPKYPQLGWCLVMKGEKLTRDDFIPHRVEYQTK